MSESGENGWDWDPLILNQILTRLPIKSIFQFKCVSKKWNSMISNTLIQSLSSTSPPSWAIMDRVVRPLPDPSPDSSPTLSLSPTLFQPPEISHISITPPFPDPFFHRFLLRPAVIDAGDGFLLVEVTKKRHDFAVESISDRTFFVINPVTRHWARLPAPPEIFQFSGSIGFVTRAHGPDIEFVVAEYRPDEARFMVFVSERERWEMKKIRVGRDPLGGMTWTRDGVFNYDGGLFWVDLSIGLVVLDEPFSRDNVVEPRLIRVPPGSRLGHNCPGLDKQRMIWRGGGGVQYVEVDGLFIRIRVWRLDDHKIKECEWNLVYNVKGMEIWGVNLWVQPVYMHPFEGNVLGFMSEDNVFYVDVGEREVVSVEVLSNKLCQLLVVPYVIPSWPLLLPPSILALSERGIGNECFKENKFDEAVSLYSRSIVHFPTAAAYANRAAAFLKIANYMLAECDCTEALKLDERYVKAYGRRALARKELGKLVEAKEDMELALKLEPQHREILKQLAEIKSMIEKVTVEDGTASQQ